MTEKELTTIEKELNITLPTSYKSTMLQFPITEFSDSDPYGIYTDVEFILNDNKEYRDHGRFYDEWPSHYFVIGNSGCGDSYFMNLEQDDRIFIAYHERGPKAIEDLELCVAAQNFQEHVNEAIKNEQEYQEEKRLIEERKKNKKWWEFWI